MRRSAGRATGNSDFRPPVECRLSFLLGRGIGNDVRARMDLGFQGVFTSGVDRGSRDLESPRSHFGFGTERYTAKPCQSIVLWDGDGAKSQGGPAFPVTMPLVTAMETKDVCGISTRCGY